MTLEKLRTPVALFAFNRPAVTKQVFEAIALARPERLFVICDGPRRDHPDDVQSISTVREIVNRIDWPCDVARC